MNTELLIKKASDHGLHDLASQILNALDSAIFAGAPVADTADYIHDIEHEIECLVDEIEEENLRTPTAQEIAVKNPFFCESCED